MRILDVLIPSNNKINFGPNTEKYQDHIFWSYGYKVICDSERYSKPYIVNLTLVKMLLINF